MKHCSIPNTWSGSEALEFVALLDRLRDAIWRAHGRKMAHHLWLEEHRPRYQRAARPPFFLYDNMQGFEGCPDPLSEEVRR